MVSKVIFRAIHYTFIFLGCIWCMSCGHRVMTMQEFYDVPNQTSSKELKNLMGSPYEVRKKEDGTQEYEYIERIKVGSRTLEERRYIFILKNDRVVSRKVIQDGPTPFETNSYKLQTSFEKPEKRED